jgi:hypothetical protein
MGTSRFGRPWVCAQRCALLKNVYGMIHPILIRRTTHGLIITRNCESWVAHIDDEFMSTRSCLDGACREGPVPSAGAKALNGVTRWPTVSVT